MKRGFTLIELITVLVVVGVISLIIIPLLYMSVKDSKEELYNQQINKLLQAGKNYGVKNPDDLPKNNGEALFMRPKDLAKLGFIDSEEILDPRNNEEINGCIVILNENDRYKYKFEENSCDNVEGEYLIKFNDNLNLKEKVEVNTVYKEQNVTATDTSGNEVSVTGPTIYKSGTSEKVNFVDTSKVGNKYDLVYQATDSNGNKKKIKIEVTIVDTIAPEIVVQGKSKNFTYYYSTSSGKFKIPEATVTDNSGKVVEYDGKKYEVYSNVSNIIGTYYIKYTAEDYSGNIRSLTVTVVIDNTDLPIIKEVTGNPTVWQNKDATLKISNVSSKSKITSYSFDDGKTWQSTNNKTFSENQTVKMKVKDQDGNVSLTYELGITKIDKTPPTKPIIVLKKNNSGGEIIESGQWTNTDVSQVQSSTDDQSGLKTYERSIDKKTWTKMDKNAIETKEQEQQYYVRAKDNAGNISEVSDMYVIRIDKTPPICGEIIVSEGTLGNNQWYITPIKFTYKNGSDLSSGHDKTVISTNQLVEDTKAGEVTLTTTDKAGNKCVVKNTYKIDKTAPNCGSAVVTSGVTGNNGWYRSDINLGVNNGSDDMSGHDKTTIDRNSINGDTPGTSVNVTTTDKAGNKCTKADTFKIDKTPPTIMIEVHNIVHSGVYTNIDDAFNNFGIYCNQKYTPGFIGIRYRGLDNLSGIDHLERQHWYGPNSAAGCGIVENEMMRVNASIYTHYLQCNSGGTAFIKARACDIAGNCSDISRATATWSVSNMANLKKGKCTQCTDQFHCYA